MKGSKLQIAIAFTKGHPLLASLTGIATLVATVLAILNSLNDLRSPTKTVKVEFEEAQLSKIASLMKPEVVSPPVISKPAAAVSNTPSPHRDAENNPLQLSDKQSRFSKLADADVSVIFNNFQGRQFAKLTVAAAGKEPVFLPVHGAGQSLTFASKAGEYIASVVNVDFDSKTLEVRVSKKN